MPSSACPNVSAEPLVRLRAHPLLDPLGPLLLAAQDVHAGDGAGGDPADHRLAAGGRGPPEHVQEPLV